MKYRIIYNGKIYRIQYRPWWFPFWLTSEPSTHRHALAGYKPIDWSKYNFETIEAAENRIEELKQLDQDEKWEVV